MRSAARVSLLSSLLLVAPTAPARADTFLATDTAALVAAMLASEANDTPTNTPDEIILTGNTTYVVDAEHGPSGSLSGLPIVSHTLTIRTDGTGPATIERSAAGTTPLFRLFEVGGVFGSAVGNLTLEDLVVRGGLVRGGVPQVNEPGGGILVRRDGQLTMRRVRVESNEASRGGGVALEGDDIGSSGTVLLEDCELRENLAEQGGGLSMRGDQELHIVRCAIVHNAVTDVPNSGDLHPGAAGGGVGILDLDGFSFGTVVIDDSTISDNRADSPFDLFIDGDGASGGGLAVESDGGIELYRSTLARNVVSGDVPIATGGGISGGGEAVIVLENVTIADNVVEQTDSGRALGGGIGGGVDDLGASFELSSVTIVGNEARVAPGASSAATADAGGIGFVISDVDFLASIVAENRAVPFHDPNDPTPAPVIQSDCHWDEGLVSSNGYNLVGGETSCVGFLPDVGDITGAPPLVAPLADNGGPTETIALLDGSPARDGVTDPLLCPETDQRAVPRATGLPCDIGAFEATTTTTTTTTTLPGATTTTIFGATTTTTTVVGPGGTTTTTLLSCGAENTLPAVRCRLGDFVSEVKAASDLGQLRTSLVTAVDAANVKATQAADVVDQKPPKARKALKAAAKKLSSFARKLRSKRAKKIIPEATRASLGEQASRLVTDLKAVAAAMR